MPLPLPIGRQPRHPSPIQRRQNYASPWRRRGLHLLAKVFVVIDLEGFALGGPFLPRELGWCDWTGQDKGSIHYKPWVPWPDLSPKDQWMAYYCTQHIHRFYYHLYLDQPYHLGSELPINVRDLYHKNNTSGLQRWDHRTTMVDPLGNSECGPRTCLVPEI